MPPEQAPLERLPIKDAAAQMGVSIDTVRRHLRQGKLHGEFEGGKWRVEVPASGRVESTSVPAPQVIAILQLELERKHEEMLRMQSIVERLISDRS